MSQHISLESTQFLRSDFAEPTGGHVSRSENAGLGRSAVVSAIAEVASPAGNDGYTSSDYERTSLALADATESLEDLTDIQREKFNYLLTKQTASPWLDRQLAVTSDGRGPKPYIERLTESNDKGFFKVPHDTFLNFLEWHNHALATKQAEYDRRQQDHKDAFHQRLAQAHWSRWIPSVAMHNVDRLNDMDVIVDDGFETEIRDLLGMAASPRGHKAYVVTVAPGEMDDDETLTHEFLHVLEGEDAEPSHVKRKYADHNKIKGLLRLFGSDTGGISMNEAVIEHLAHSMVHGNFDVVDPIDPARHGAVYVAGRRLFHTLTIAGREPIDPRIFAAALFENQRAADGSGRHSAQRQLVEAIDHAFPFANVVEEIADLTADDESAGVKIVTDYATELQNRAELHNSLQWRLARLDAARKARIPVHMAARHL